MKERAKQNPEEVKKYLTNSSPILKIIIIIIIPLGKTSPIGKVPHRERVFISSCNRHGLLLF